ncbi:serine/threonine-protein kinase [Frankia sp. Cr2]|uniref:serine/threonine-protein kinase n=1 Tax=Frankia sp. Cr2 TaxID=3073932 RepID=UPI002AD524F3|nr:serine/threonine-protein kinase [Frankia sp. Cr2]
MPLQPGDSARIGRYRVVGRLGVGGMGVVYLGQDEAGRPVAVKVIKEDLAADPEFRARFADEVAAAGRVAPFCTAQVLDADPGAYPPYLVTEYIDGVRLDDVVTARGPLVLSTLQGVAVGVASALTAIHGAGIVHRDLKPSNVLLSYSGPRVIDFGIARALDAVVGRTRTGLVLGSAGWMAPEQMEGAPVGPAADVFAWGLLIAYAAAGCHPFGDGAPLEIAQRIVMERPYLGGVPEDLRPLVAAALNRDPRARPSAEDLVLALLGDQARARSGTRAAVPEVLDGTWSGGRRGQSAVGAVAARPVHDGRTRLGVPQAPAPERYAPEPPVPERYAPEPPVPERYARGRYAEGRYKPERYAPERYAPPRRRRRWRPRIPGKRLVILLLLIFLVMSGVDRVTHIWDTQRGRLWEQVWTHVQDGFQHEVVDRFQRDVVDRVRNKVDDTRTGVDQTGSARTGQG